MLLIVDCGSTKTPQFAVEAAALGVESHTIKMEAFPTTELDAYQHIIISGAPILVTEVAPQPYLTLFQPLLSANCPMLGVCFGHQISGMLHGAEASRCPEDRNWQTITLTGNSTLFDGFKDSARMMQDHCECISLPADWQLLGSSTTCEVEAMQHPTKPWFGVQFHPEVSGADGRLLLQNFLSVR